MHGAQCTPTSAQANIFPDVKPTHTHTHTHTRIVPPEARAPVRVVTSKTSGEKYSRLEATKPGRRMAKRGTRTSFATETMSGQLWTRHWLLPIYTLDLSQTGACAPPAIHARTRSRTHAHTHTHTHTLTGTNTLARTHTHTTTVGRNSGVTSGQLEDWVRAYVHQALQWYFSMYKWSGSSSRSIPSVCTLLPPWCNTHAHAHALERATRHPAMHSALKIGVRGTFCARPMLS